MASRKNAKRVVKKDANLPVLSVYRFAELEPKALQEVITANIGASISEFDLQRITVPTGGGQQWNVKTLRGEENIPDLTGVIVSWKEPRAFWRESFDSSGGGTPPDCSSADGEHGNGDPGGECSKCPYSAFGSDEEIGKKGRGQACKQMRMIFMLRQGDLLPLVISCPPTSLRALRQYFLRLASSGTPYYAVETELTLMKVKNKDGIKYSEITPVAKNLLKPAETAIVKSYSEAITGRLTTVRAAAQDYGGEAV